MPAIDDAMDAMRVPHGWRHRRHYVQLALVINEFAQVEQVAAYVLEMWCNEMYLSVEPRGEDLVERVSARFTQYLAAERLSDATQREPWYRTATTTGLWALLPWWKGDDPPTLTQVLERNESALVEYLGYKPYRGVTEPCPRRECRLAPTREIQHTVAALSRETQAYLSEIFTQTHGLQDFARQLPAVVGTWIYEHHHTTLDDNAAPASAREAFGASLGRLRSASGNPLELSDDWWRWRNTFNSSPPLYRVYLHPAFGSSLELMEFVGRELMAIPQVIEAKIALAKWAGSVPDTIAIYPRGDECLQTVLERVTAFINEQRVVMLPRVPGLTQTHAPGVSWAACPQRFTSRSFGQDRSDRIAVAVYDLLLRCEQPDEPAFVEAVADYFAIVGLDLAAPHAQYAGGEVRDVREPLARTPLAQPSAHQRGRPAPPPTRSPRRPHGSPAQPSSSSSPTTPPAHRAAAQTGGPPSPGAPGRGVPVHGAQSPSRPPQSVARMPPAQPLVGHPLAPSKAPPRPDRAPNAAPTHTTTTTTQRTAPPVAPRRRPQPVPGPSAPSPQPDAQPSSRPPQRPPPATPPTRASDTTTRAPSAAPVNPSATPPPRAAATPPPVPPRSRAANQSPPSRAPDPAPSQRPPRPERRPDPRDIRAKFNNGHGN